MKKCWRSVCLVMILPLLGTAAAQPGNRRATQLPVKSEATPTKKKYCVLPEILWAIGDKYNLYFTVELERASVATESMNWSWSRAASSLPAPPCDYLLPGATDVYQELQGIQRDLPNLGYVVDRGDPKIIHIYNKELLKFPAYPMGREMGSLQFKGNAAELAHLLYQRGALVSFRLDYQDEIVDNRPGEPCDYVRNFPRKTRIDVDVTGATVRELLSSFTRTNPNERILWMSSTSSFRQAGERVRLELGFFLVKSPRPVIFRKTGCEPVPQKSDPTSP